MHMGKKLSSTSANTMFFRLKCSYVFKNVLSNNLNNRNLYFSKLLLHENDEAITAAVSSHLEYRKVCPPTEERGHIAFGVDPVGFGVLPK